MSDGEFDLINRWFRPIAGKNAHNLMDDCASFTVRENFQLVTSTDIVLEGVHFPENAPSDIMINRALGAAHSDLAASGASPIGYQIGLSLKGGESEAWFSSFAGAQHKFNEAHDSQLLGGDIVSGAKQHMVSVTVYGEAKKPVLRRGAKPGDIVCVTGTLGDAAAGLALYAKRFSDLSSDQGYLLSRYTKPTPRLAVSGLVSLYANAALDISDGAVSDLRHMIEASNCGAEVFTKQIPISGSLQRVEKDPSLRLRHALAGGDDYEIIMSIKPEYLEDAKTGFQKHGVPLTDIGVITADRSLTLYAADGSVLNFKDFKGYTHTG